VWKVVRWTEEGLCRRHGFSVVPACSGVFASSSRAVVLSGNFLERVAVAVQVVATRGSAGVVMAYWRVALFAR
jgi:hypothetical protein